MRKTLRKPVTPINIYTVQMGPATYANIPQKMLNNMIKTAWGSKQGAHARGKFLCLVKERVAVFYNGLNYTNDEALAKAIKGIRKAKLQGILYTLNWE